VFGSARMVFASANLEVFRPGRSGQESSDSRDESSIPYEGHVEYEVRRPVLPVTGSSSSTAGVGASRLEFSKYSKSSTSSVGATVSASDGTHRSKQAAALKERSSEAARKLSQRRQERSGGRRKHAVSRHPDDKELDLARDCSREIVEDWLSKSPRVSVDIVSPSDPAGCPAFAEELDEMREPLALDQGIHTQDADEVNEGSKDEVGERSEQKVLNNEQAKEKNSRTKVEESKEVVSPTPAHGQRITALKVSGSAENETTGRTGRERKGSMEDKVASAIKSVTKQNKKWSATRSEWRRGDERSLATGMNPLVHCCPPLFLSVCLPRPWSPGNNLQRMTWFSGTHRGGSVLRLPDFELAYLPHFAELQHCWRCASHAV
jgi:hypothetical protein